MKNSHDLNSEVVVIENNNQEIYISIYKDSSLSENIVSAVLYKVEGYFGIHIETKQDYIGQGYGPLLYDIAIEYATMKGKGLISSSAASELFNISGSTSEDAERVYNYYYKNRQDVKKTPLVTNNMIDLPPHLSCVYQKSPEKINELKKNKRLFVDKEVDKIHDFIHSDVKYDRAYYKSGKMEDLIKHFIVKTPELNSQLNKISRQRDGIVSDEFHLFGEKYNKVSNLVYNYIRRFNQIKDQPYVKEKNITKYSWKQLMAIADYRKTDLFGEQNS